MSRRPRRRALRRIAAGIVAVVEEMRDSPAMSEAPPDFDAACGVHIPHATATHSISISNSIGQDATGTKLRAGGSVEKYVA